MFNVGFQVEVFLGIGIQCFLNAVFQIEWVLENSVQHFAEPSFQNENSCWNQLSWFTARLFPKFTETRNRRPENTAHW